jgi:hypothetical protein
MSRSVAKVSQTSQSQNEEDIMNVPIGIDINGLNDIDKARLSQIGVWKWMDEICNAVKAPRRELPASAPSSTRLSKAGKRCLKFGMLDKRKAAPAAPRSQYCTANCRESDAIRKQRLMLLEAVQNPSEMGII